MSNRVTGAVCLLAAAAIGGGAGTAWAQQPAPAPTATAAPTPTAAPAPVAAPADSSAPPAAATIEAPPATDARATAGNAVATPAPPLPAAKPSRWHGSILLFDQSVTTQTVHIGGDYQSYNPTYELWLAFKPRYFLYETEKSALSVNLWANLYLELTDSDTTTYLRQPLLGPTYVWSTFSRTFARSKETKTVLSIGPRAVLPTDKASLGSGQFIGLGGLAGASQYVGLRGADARTFKSARVGVSAIYNHPFARATLPTNENIQQVRQDIGGRTVVSDLLTGTMNVKNALSLSASGDLRLLPNLEFSLSYVWLNSWGYPPPGVDVPLPTGPVNLMPVDNAHYRLSTWATASLTYEPTDDFSVSVGYYNLANQLGLDGTRREPLWSPNARFFLTVTGNLDIIYARVTGQPHAVAD